MLSEPLIGRCLQRQDHDRLLQALQHNGLPMPLPLRIRLADSSLAVAALGLRRLAELTYGPTPVSRTVTRQLLAAQGRDGAYEQCPLATGCAASALARVIREHRADDKPVQAHGRAIAALAGLQQPDGSFMHAADRTASDRALTSLFVLYLLADDLLLRQSIRFADLLSFLEQQADSFDSASDDLWQMTLLMLRPAAAVVAQRPAPALAA